MKVTIQNPLLGLAVASAEMTLYIDILFVSIWGLRASSIIQLQILTFIVNDDQWIVNLNPEFV